MKIVCIVSGGMDSVTMASYYAAQGDETAVLSFDYGQRHRREIACAASCARRLGSVYQIADLRGIAPLLAGSALTSDGIEVPLGHYADESMKVTIVPNRNAIMLSVATGWCVSLGYDAVAFGVHGGDHPIYPDCRPEFKHAMNTALYLGNAGSTFQGVLAPFITKDKTEIVRIGTKLGVPFDQTWSCYLGEMYHCGECGTCVERREAFQLAGVEDPTHYVGIA